jgi:hypothetical protein
LQFNLIKALPFAAAHNFVADTNRKTKYAPELFEQPRAEMPFISRPDSLDGNTFRELSDDGFNSRAQIGQRARQPELLRTCFTERSVYFQGATLCKLKQARRPVISIAQTKAARFFEQIKRYRLLLLFAANSNAVISPGNFTRKCCLPRKNVCRAISS